MNKMLFALLAILSVGNYTAQDCSTEYKAGETLFLNDNNSQVVIPDSNRTYKHINAIPPRFQWNANGGYCGEISMISAGLLYGQYLSQFDVRNYANPGANGNQTSPYQLLLGVNDQVAAQALKFKFECLQSNNNVDFLTWAKHHVALGHTVIIGVLNNENQIYTNSNPDAGHQTYDHIVPVTGFYSNQPLANKYDISDVILLSDNGVYTPLDYQNIYYCSPPKTTPAIDSVPYLYAVPVGDFCLNREQANNPNGITYSLLKLPHDNKVNYGIAITGYLGDEFTKPVHLKVNYNYEYPCIVDKTSDRPKAMDIELTVTVCELTKGKSYQIFLYENLSEVPIDKIKKDSAHLWKTFKADGTSFTTVLKTKTDKQLIFRAIEISE